MTTTIAYNSFGEDFVLHPRITAYANGRTCIEFWLEGEWGLEPFTKVTVNMPDIHLNEGELLVKDWSENAEFVEFLVQEGWLIRTGREVSSGYVFPAVMRAAGPLAEVLDSADGV